MLEGKKTLIGLVLSGVAQVFNQVAAMLDNDPLTNPDYMVMTAGLVIIIGAVDRLRRGGSVAASEAASAKVVSPGNSVQENR